MAPQQRYLGQKDPKTGKVWAGDGWGWQAPASYTRLAGRGELNTQRNPMNWVNNNLAHLLNVSNRANQGTKLVGSVGFLPIYEDKKGQFSSSTPAQRQVAHATTVQPLANASLAVTNLGQRLLSGKPFQSVTKRTEDTAVGRAIVGLRREAAIGMGATPIEQLPPDQRSLLVDLPSSLATNTALAFVPGLRVGEAAFAGAAAKVPFLSQGAQQVLARSLRWGANAGINEAASGMLDDSTQGQGGDLLKAAGVPVPDAFVTQPGDDRIQAGLRGIVPGIALGEALGLPFGLASKGLELAPNAMRSLREQRITGDLNRVRQETVNTGLQQPDALGGFEFPQAPAAAEGARSAPATSEAAPAAEAVPATAGAGDVIAPAVEPPARSAPTEQGLTPPPDLSMDQLPDGPAEGVVDTPQPAAFDPSLPELDAPALALDQMDDQTLKAVAAGGGPVLPRIEEALATAPLADVNPGRSTVFTAAPAESLVAPDVPWREQWEQLPNQELLGAAHPDVSPDLFQATQAVTGKDFSQLTRTDVLDGLSQLEQQGQVVMPQRLQPEQQLVDVQGLQVDPQRLQFRAGADLGTGVVPGQGLRGAWDPSQEGSITYWQDPQTGQQTLVDGHRRVEAARRLGIPTIPGEEVLAPTADAARTAGAVRNIAGGTAAPLDAGRELRQIGVTDPAGLEAVGIPLEQGAPGLALARLPESVNNWVEQGVLPEARAQAIGASGLSEPEMRSAARFSRSQAGQTLSDQEFGEVMALAGAKPQADALSRVTAIQQQLDSTDQYIAGPVRIERERYDNGGSSIAVDVGPADRLPAEYLAKRGIADPASVSKVRQVTLLRDYTMEQLRQLPAGDYRLDALTEGHRRIYRRWFSGGKVSGISDSPNLAGDSWVYRPQDDPKALLNQPASAGKTRSVAGFADLVERGRLAAAVKQQLPAELQGVFDQMKGQQDGPVSLLLEQGAAELANGALPNVVARRVEAQVREAAAGMTPEPQIAAPVDAAAAGVDGPLTAADRQALKAQLLQQAVSGGEVRPSSQPTIPAPDPVSVDVPTALADLERQLQETGTIAEGTPAHQLLEEEARLEEVYMQRDAVVQAEMAKAEREAAGYWQLTFDERVRQGLIGEGWERSGALNSIRRKRPEQAAAITVPESAVRPFDQLDRFQQARAVNELRKQLGTHEAGLNMDGGDTYAQRKLEVKGAIDLDVVLGADVVKRAKEQFASNELGPEALQVRQVVRDFYGFKASDAPKPFYIELGGDIAAQNAVAENLRQIVRQVAGEDADVRLMDRYRMGKRKAEWGGGEAEVVKLGSYQVMRDVVSINGVLEGTQSDLVKTAFHEAFHRVQYGLLTQPEMRVLDSAYGLQRITNYSNLPPDRVASIERMAVAFQNYAAARRAGADPMASTMLEQLRKGLKEPLSPGVEKVVVGVAAAFEKVLDVIDRFRNFAKGNGFQTVDDIFERAYSGRLAKERAFNSALEYIEPDQVKRAKRLDQWTRDNEAPLRDISAEIAKLDEQIQALKTKATTGGC